jgi:hypothetical protein
MSEHIDPPAVDAAVSHGPMILIGAGAALIRLATYAGPPRPWRAVLLDGLAMAGVAFGTAEGVIGWGGNQHTAIAVGLASGLVGWELVKRAVSLRAMKKDT